MRSPDTPINKRDPSCGVLVESIPFTKMTAKKSGSRLETEIERCRSECQWDKIPELVRQLSAKLISNGKRRAVFHAVHLFSLLGPSPLSPSSVLPDSGSRAAGTFPPPCWGLSLLASKGQVLSRVFYHFWPSWCILVVRELS